VGMIAILRRAIGLMLVILALGLTSCGGDNDVPVVLLAGDATEATANRLVGAIAEVSPPERIQQLKPYLDVYAPQVRIATPDPDTTLTSTTVQVEVQVRDFPIYKDPSVGFGPHLHLFVDDQPHQAIYDANEPVILENLAPGTHVLRLLAVRPWGESFKNEGAYDQVVFNVFAPSPQNNPDDSQPVLTYNQPQGSYGAEPILLDFHLSNAPPHLVAQADEAITDWRIRCTVNGESFVFDRWQPIYLQGFQPGKNWLKLELIDDNGNLIDNALNTTVRVIDYQPGGKDSLSQLVRGEISLAQAKVLIDPNYEPPKLKEEASTKQSDPATTPDSSAASTEQEVSPPVADELEEPDATAAPEPQAEPSANATTPGDAEITPEAGLIEGSDQSDETETVVPQPMAADDSETEAVEVDLPATDEAAQPTSDSGTAGAIDTHDNETGTTVEDQSGQPQTDSKATTPAAVSPSIVEESENALNQDSQDPSTSSQTIPDQVDQEATPSIAPPNKVEADEPEILNTDQPLSSAQDADIPAVANPATVPTSSEEEDFTLDETASSESPSDAETLTDEAVPNTDLNTLEDNADLI
jgi:hypothetical protein